MVYFPSSFTSQNENYRCNWNQEMRWEGGLLALQFKQVKYDEPILNQNLVQTLELIII